MKKIIIIFIVSVCMLNGYKAHAQTELLSGMYVNEIIENLKKAAAELLNEGDYIISKSEFDVRISLLTTLDAFDYILEKNIDKTFENLSEQQRSLLININNTIVKAKKNGKILLNESELLIDKANIFASTLPGGKRRPVISSVSPSYFCPTSQRDIPITIKGAFLSKGDPYITLGDIRYTTETGSKIDSKLEFLLPLDKFTDTTKIKLVSSKLTVYHRRFFHNKPVNYTIGVYLVPELLGTYKLYTRVNTEQKVSVQRKQTFQESNAHCQGGRNVVWKFNSQGKPWKIDVNSINDKSTSVTSKSRYNGVSNITENGFRITGRVENSGECAKVLGQTIAKDARGSIKGIVTWKEYRIIEKTNDLGLLAEGNIYWGQDIIFDLPSNLHSFRLEVNQINKEIKKITSSSQEQWFEVVQSPKGNDLTIKPFEIEDALK